MTAPSVAPDVTSDVWAAVEPLRMAVHALANQQDRTTEAGREERNRLVLLAVDITAATTALAAAVKAAEHEVTPG